MSSVARDSVDPDQMHCLPDIENKVKPTYLKDKFNEQFQFARTETTTIQA